MKHWTSIWGNANSIVENTPANYGKDLTLRYAILVPFDASDLRFSLDNFTGNEDVTFNEVTVAVQDQGEDAKFGSVYPVMFDGFPSFTLRKGEKHTCDAIPISLHAGETVLISFYLKDYTELRCGVTTSGPLSNRWFARGNHASDAVFPRDKSNTCNWVYFLSRVDLKASTGKSVLCYGDSITAQDWPEDLQMMFVENRQNIGVVRKAVSGARILRQYDAVRYECYGLKGTTRFPREVRGYNIHTIIIQQGINDIIHPVGVEVNEFRPWTDLPTAEEIIDGLRWYVEESRKMGCQVYLGTLTPIKGWRTYADFRNDLREQVNTWIRTTNEIDGYIDFDAALRDPEDRLRLKPEYDSGDHLHPSPKGYQRMAEFAYYILTH